MPPSQLVTQACCSCALYAFMHLSDFSQTLVQVPPFGGSGAFFAVAAAVAANAAGAQGKYFEYIDLLYRNQSALDAASLKKYAAGWRSITAKPR